MFLSITPLLLCEEYYNDLLCGLIISAGESLVSVTFENSDFLFR